MEATSPPFDELAEWLINYAYKVTTIDPCAQFEHKEEFAAKELMGTYFELPGLRFPSKLHAILSDTKPPSIERTKTFPPPETTDWGMYVVIAELVREIHFVYVGSGAVVNGALRRRCQDYKPYNQAVFWQKDEGRSIRGVQDHLHWRHWRLRAPGGASTIAYTRHLTLHPTPRRSVHLRHMGPCESQTERLWPTERTTMALYTFEDNGLCSHSPLKEVRDVEMTLTSEGLEQRVAMMREATLERARKGYTRRKAVDAVGFSAARKAEKRISTKNPQAKINRQAIQQKQASRERNQDAFECDRCGNTFSMKIHLADHVKAHGDQEAGIRYECHCGESYGTLDRLQRHLKDAHAIRTGAWTRCRSRCSQLTSTRRITAARVHHWQHVDTFHTIDRLKIRFAPPYTQYSPPLSTTASPPPPTQAHPAPARPRGPRRPSRWSGQSPPRSKSPCRERRAPACRWSRRPTRPTRRGSWGTESRRRRA